MIVIIDYGMGNLGSVKNIIKKIGFDSVTSSKKEDIKSAEKLILPGVGAFDQGIKNIHELNLFDVLNEKVISENTPILGICLGFQLLCMSSEEGKLNGLGWIDAVAKRFCFDDENKKNKIPHMGWNSVEFDASSSLFAGWQDDARFYFVHSYHVVCNSKDIITSECFYGSKFVASIQKNNIYGTQFHPEKSHKYGMKILRNFLGL
jgi:imidazole glycerol-phosphate synthase subunit HisH